MGATSRFLRLVAFLFFGFRASHDQRFAAGSRQGHPALDPEKCLRIFPLRDEGGERNERECGGGREGNRVSVFGFRASHDQRFAAGSRQGHPALDPEKCFRIFPLRDGRAGGKVGIKKASGHVVLCTEAFSVLPAEIIREYLRVPVQEAELRDAGRLLSASPSVQVCWICQRRA